MGFFFPCGGNFRGEDKSAKNVKITRVKIVTFTVSNYYYLPIPQNNLSAKFNKSQQMLIWTA